MHQASLQSGLVYPESHLGIHTVLVDLIVLYCNLHVLDINGFDVLYGFGRFIEDILDSILKTNRGVP